MSVAKELSKFREDKGISLRALGALAGISYSRVCNIENEKQRLTIEKLIRLCQALNVPTEVEQDWIHRLREKILLAG